MGTRFSLLLPGVHDARGSQLFSAVVRELNRLENMLSWFIPSSEVSYINAMAYKQAVEVDPELYDVLLDCKRLHSLSLGLFDIGMGKAIDFWKGNQDGKFPEPVKMGSGMKFIDFNEPDKRLRFMSPHVKLDLGGYGKGYALDRIVQLLKERSVESACISFGESSVACIGKHPHGNFWPVGVQDPFNPGEVLKSFQVVDGAVSTSSNLEVENHVIHPKKALPLKEKVLASVKAASARDAEVLSTMCLLLEKEQIKTLLPPFGLVEITRVNYSNQKAETFEYQTVKNE